MTTLSDLTTAVAAEKTVQEGALALIRGLAKAINDAQGSSDPRAMDVLLAEINEQSAPLATAVASVPITQPAPPTPVPAAGKTGPQTPGPTTTTTTSPTA